MKRGSSKKAGPGYTLVVCEKPDAAKRVADALASGTPETFKVGRVSAFRVEGVDGSKYVVCAASGHLYGVSETAKDRRVYPALDLEWFPLSELGRKSIGLAASRIAAVKSLSKGADSFVNACDLDVEGETIGYNILRYACGGKEGSARRARFSSLTDVEIREAFKDMSRPLDGLARAGRLRHAIDFAWGVNLSRAVSESFRRLHGFRLMSIGRVQGPTLNFAVQKENEVNSFVPTPYWSVSGRFLKDGVNFEASYSSPTVAIKSVADLVKRECEGHRGVVSKVSRSRIRESPPPPPNLSDLQKEAFKLFGYSPSKTLQVAERLYLGAMISYPRTESQKLPRGDHSSILSRISEIPGYSGLVREILSGGLLHPVEGRKTDSAHPAIYPTGQHPRSLDAEERNLFDLVVRRFLACFGEDSVRDLASFAISVDGHQFVAERRVLVEQGWTRFLSLGRRWEDVVETPVLSEGDEVSLKEVVVEERLKAKPPRFNQASLLEKMEREGIGTKATRADTISTLLTRGYLSGGSLVPTELGLSLVGAMEAYCPQIVSTELTREVEARLDEIERSGESGSEFFDEVLSKLLAQVIELRQHEQEIGAMIRADVKGPAEQLVLGDCPVCKEGKLLVIRSRKSGKRFVGCSRYSSGCRASSPLPQRGKISSRARPCPACSWPVVRISSGRRPWVLCVNDRCPRKVNVYRMKA